ncbi:glycosyltransferase family 39 protein [Maribacter halichondriae]|uniref:glycosyltransferase family 39 protein n=1 Tax=Maribacter halichondriae TaxID=2980554 RepID=UPI002358C1FA|nr:glycosyltransferase family 39 protein [Maribacter sp. Hal144]
MKKWFGNKVNLVVLLFAVINVLIHLLIYNNLEFHRDELLYFALGRHPDFGYMTVPPLIGWIATLMQNIFGYSLFAVKLFPAILSGVMVLLSSSLAKELGGKSYAQILTAVAIIVMPISLRAFHLFQPVPLDMFFWTLILFYIVRYLNLGKDKYLVIIGALSGIAMLNKYLVALLIGSFLIALLFSERRKVFTKRAFYIGILIGILIFLPNILWQIFKEFPVIGHMNALKENQLANVDRLSFLTDQLFMPLASAFLFVLGFVFLIRSNKYRVLGITALLVIAILLLLRGKSYYTIGLFPLIVAAGTLIVEKYVKHLVPRIIIPAIMVLLTLPILPFGMPIYGQQGLIDYYADLEKDFGLLLGRTFEDGSVHSLPQDYADQLGWEELAQITAKAYEQIPDKEKAAIYCENYGQAGAISVIGKKHGLPEPLCFHESFVYWVPEKFNPDIEYFIYINDELGEDVNELFQDVKVVGSISNEHAREFGTTVYLCSRPKSSFNAFGKT